jgi:hypothetical protein
MSKKQKGKRGWGETTSGTMSRRVAIKLMGLVPWYGKIVVESVAAEPGAQTIHGLVHATLAESGSGAQGPRSKLTELAYDLFFKGADTDIVPPGNWEPKRADIEVRPGLKTYAHEYHVMKAMKESLPDLTHWALRDTCWDARPEDSLICLGSGVSNEATRAFLGDIKREPKLTVDSPQGKIQLAYAMVRMEGFVQREQYGQTYTGPASAIVDSTGRPIACPEARERELKEDYLLVTRLPGWAGADGTSVLIFAGLHGPGTRSTELIFTSIDPKELSYLAGKIGLSTDAPTPCFQAVLRATSFCLKDGSHVAQELTCMKTNCPPVILKAV